MRDGGGLVIGQQGSEKGQLDEVLDMALDSQGYLYVLQKKRNIIEVFNPLGQFVTWIAPSKIGFQNALAIEVSLANELYVLDQELSSVFVYNVEGRMINAHRSLHKKQGVVLQKAQDFVVLQDGGFMILDDGTGDVLAFDKDGLLRTTIQVAGTEGEFKKAQCLSVSLARSPHLAVTFDARKSVKIFDVVQYGPTVYPALQRMYMAPWEGNAWGVKELAGNVHGDAAIIVSDQSKSIVVLDKNGKEKFALKDAFDQPVDVVLDNDGVLHVVDKGAGVIKVFDASGELIRTLGNEKQAKLKSPSSLVQNSLGQLIVCDEKSGNLMVWSREGAYQKVFLEAEKSRLTRPQKLAVDSKDQIYVWDIDQNAIFRIAASGWPIALKKLQLPGDSGDESIGTIGDFYIDPMDQLHVLNLTTGQLEIYRWDLEPVRCFSMGNIADGPYGLKDVSHIALDPFSFHVYACDEKGKINRSWLFSESPVKPICDLRWDLAQNGDYCVFFDATHLKKNTGFGLVNQETEDGKVLLSSTDSNITVRADYKNLEQPMHYALVAINRVTASEKGTSFKDYLGWAEALEIAGFWEKALVAYTQAMAELDKTERLHQFLISKLGKISSQLMDKKEVNKAMAFLRLANQYAPHDEKINALYCKGYQVMFAQTIEFQHINTLLNEIELHATRPQLRPVVACAIDGLCHSLLANGQSWDIDNAITLQKKWMQINGQPTDYHTLAKLQLTNYHNHKRENRSPNELQGLLQEAADHAEESRKQAKDSSVLLTILAIYNEQGNFAETEKRATVEINNLNKNWTPQQNVQLHELLAKSFVGQKKYQLALNEYERILLLEPTNHFAMLSKAAMLKQTGALEEALVVYEKEQTKSQDDTQVLRAIGEIYLEKNDLNNAVFQFEKAVRIAPQDKSLYAPLAMTYHKQGLYKRAVEHWQIAFDYSTTQLQKGKGGLLTANAMQQATNDWLQTGYALADDAIDAQQYDMAIKTLELLKLELPKQAATYFRLGLAQTNRGMYYEAANAYFVACKWDPSNAEYANAHKGVVELIESTANSKLPLAIVDVSTVPLYPALYQNYSSKQQLPLGHLIVSNNTQLPITPTSVTVFIPEFMSQPTAIANPALMGFSDSYIQINALIDEKVLLNLKAKEVGMDIELQFVINGQLEVIKKSTSIVCMGRNAINWQDKLALGAFVTSGDSELLGIHRQTDLVLTNELANQIPNAIVKATQYFSVFDNWKGLAYSADPNTPYAKASTNNALIDYLQFPSEMLRSKAGDCDDFVALFDALMESAGVRSAFVDMPGHVFAAIELGAGPSEILALGISPQEVIIKNNRVWIPVETTLLGKTGFLEAWSKAAERYQAELQVGHFPELIEISVAHNKYLPATNVPTLSAFDIEIGTAAMKKFDHELFKLTAKMKREQLVELEDRYLREPENVFVKNKYAMLLARTGEASKAEIILKEAIALTPDNAVVLNNLGNVAFINGNYDNALLNYNSAALADDGDSQILINICHTLLALNRKTEAKEIYEKAVILDAEVTQLYPHLKTKVQ